MRFIDLNITSHLLSRPQTSSLRQYAPATYLHKAGSVPRANRAVTVYGNLIRRTFKDKPIIIGGIEASLRRLAHYDYWQDKLKRSVLLDSSADILLYGMGEHSIVEVADALDGGLPVEPWEIVPVKNQADLYYITQSGLFLEVADVDSDGESVRLSTKKSGTLAERQSGNLKW